MTKRAQIVAEVLNHLQGITVENEFATDLGLVIEPWTGIPFKLDDGAIAAELRDVREEQDERVSGHHNRVLTLEVAMGAAMGKDGPDTIREMIGDLEYRLGEYRTSGTSLVFNVQLQSNDIGVEQKEQFVAVGRVTFRVSYRTASFNPDA